MLIGVDFDGVIADGTNQKVLWAKEELGVDLKPEETSKITSFPKFSKVNYRLPDGSSLSGKALYEYMMVQIAQTERTLGYDLVPFCKEALSSLIAKGHRVCVVTSRGRLDSIYARKFMRMNKIPYDNFFRTKSDYKRDFLVKYGFDVMIDDTYDKLLPLSGTSIISLLFTTPWNLGVKIDKPGIARVEGWRDVLGMVDAISSRRESEELRRRKVA